MKSTSLYPIIRFLSFIWSFSSIFTTLDILKSFCVAYSIARKNLNALLDIYIYISAHLCQQFLSIFELQSFHCDHSDYLTYPDYPGLLFSLSLISQHTPNIIDCILFFISQPVLDSFIRNFTVISFKPLSQHILSKIS